MLNDLGLRMLMFIYIQRKTLETNDGGSLLLYIYTYGMKWPFVCDAIWDGSHLDTLHITKEH